MFDLDRMIEKLELDALVDKFHINKEALEEIYFEELVDLYYDDPCGFSEDILGVHLDPHQKDILISVRDNKRTSVRSGQGVGKTMACACLIIWYMTFRPECKVIATAPTFSQLTSVLWPEISKWLQGTIVEDYFTVNKTTMTRNCSPMTWFAMCKTSNRKENMLGLHSEFMLIICDEAPGIDDEILEALLGTISDEENKIILIGNPVKNTGIFFDSHHSLKENFKCIHIDATKVARTDKENHKMLKKKYGEESNVFRCLVKGDFPLEEDDIFIQLSTVYRGINSEIIRPTEPVTIDMGVDVARFGSDKTSIMTKIDGYVEEPIYYQGKDTMKTVGEVLRKAKSLHGEFPKLAVVVKIDDTGVGGGVTDRLKEIKFEEKLDWLKVVPCKFGMPLKRGSQAYAFYYDTTTYIASVVKELLEDDELRLPNNTDLVGELTTRKFKVFNSKGQIKLESKDEMKKRGLHSPDLADSLFLACLPVGSKLRKI